SGYVDRESNRRASSITQNREVKPVKSHAGKNETYTDMATKADPDEMARLEKDALLAMEANIARETRMTEAERMTMKKEMERDALSAMAEQADRDGGEVPWAKD
ncbi:MAG: hypothetical protein L3J79_11055, partial [Candidatus Marinimicrobia bacterium]|nr:hypothetical protein [Candidatus Neomarinimicrobiota bacterium]